MKRLEELGFTILHRASGLWMMKREHHRVMVPDIESLEVDMLHAILRSAGVSEEEFVRRRSGFYAKTPRAAPASVKKRR